MARRRKDDSLLEDLLDLSTKLSWKANLVIAGTSYFGFHYWASLPRPIASDNSLSDLVLKQALISFSNVFQYLVPAIFLLGTAVSIFKNKKRAELLAQQTSFENIKALPWRDFEKLVGEAFKRKGFEVHENGGGGADGGIDLVLYKGGRKTIVQCKRWKSASVSVTLVRELYGVMAAENASDCILVSSGFYTSEAKLFAENKPIWLIDGPELLNLIAEIRSASAQAEIYSSVRSLHEEKNCPLCGSVMVQRIAKKGMNAGKAFWGCSRFPACRGTR